MSSRTSPTRVIPDAPPANILIPSQQTFEHADGERIRARAHELWVAAGCPDGDGVAFWYKAEHEIRGG